MLDKIKNIGAQVTNKANDAVEGITSSVKGGVESLANTASTVTGKINEQAVRTSTAQMCSILEIALEEIKSRPLSKRPVSLTATVNFGIAALEMQIHLEPSEKENESEIHAQLSPPSA
jgi:hypothetical protein